MLEWALTPIILFFWGFSYFYKKGFLIFIHKEKSKTNIPKGIILILLAFLFDFFLYYLTRIRVSYDITKIDLFFGVLLLIFIVVRFLNEKDKIAKG